ncbi:uncharacterized protein LOC141601609 [Silene latifolia]|uniref:uncharacterized protein LOC141601609 n=1 Tax=Silene latifolia TaxID=37657 RepID=UPI003D774715
MAQAEADVQKLKESESSLKQKLGDKASGSKLKIQPGTPFSSIIRNIDFSNFAKIDLPKNFVVPSMRIYDGTTNPQNHVAYYKQRMLVASIPSELLQVCMCKGFGTTLTGPALQWYINLPNGSIKSFADLINSFNHQFTSSRELEKRSIDLYKIMQKPGETIRAFLTRFNKEKVSFPSCDVGTAVEAFTQGLPLDSDFYDELTMKPCLTFEDNMKTWGVLQNTTGEHIDDSVGAES